ncbi:1-acyl-sn-glycerol-3-phosphate acyltransferase [Cerasibacillus terrae]|uniref:1-acyl-sn-glycerol-3-phosphate acyltransferase n=1 Tax=Cerasibacillus terrae TaxID=2498845 RepID=A0A5C8NRX6_9BACI|nr:1-acyl-sn-glycerol-3-phosphate acyltransferase [Cerasibacillus terrae]
MIYNFAARLLNIILSMFGRIKVNGKENLPKSDGYVIACTHTGWVDILWLGISVFPTKLHFMAKKELFETAFTKWLMEQLNAFPVNRENPGPSAIKIPRNLIKEGKVVGIFPSGTRTTEDVPLKRGAVTIANLANAPIVPAAYIGPNNFKDLFKRKKPSIIFGEPIYMEKDLPKKERINQMMHELEGKMKVLQTELREHT